MRPAHYRTGEQLTSRQKQVLQLIAIGKTNPEIADILGISLDWAKWLFHRFEVCNRAVVTLSRRLFAAPAPRGTNSLKCSILALRERFDCPCSER